MSKQLPSQEKTIFLLCEDIRQELGGKISLLGVIPANHLTLEGMPQNSADAVIPSLTFVFLFRDGEGEFNGKVGIIAPDEKELIPENEHPMKKGAKDTMNTIFKLAPFKVMTGKFKPYVVLDGQRYEREFEVQQIQSSPAPA